MSDENKKPNYRLAHTMIRVLDLDKSINFYCDILGMQILRKTDYPGGRFTNTFIGYGPESEFPTLELTHNWDQEGHYDKGNGCKSKNDWNRSYDFRAVGTNCF